MIKKTLFIVFFLFFINFSLLFSREHIKKIATLKMEIPVYPANIKVLKKIIIVTSKHNIYKFSLPGKLIKKMGNKGQGPGDYLYIFSWDYYEDRIYINDIKMFRISILDIKNLNIINSFIWNYGSPIPGRIAVCKDYILKSQINYNQKDLSYSTVLFLFNKEGKLLKMFHNIGKQISSYFRMELWPPLVSSDKEKFFYVVMQPVYKIYKYNIYGDLIKAKEIKREWFIKLKKWDKKKFDSLNSRRKRVKYYVNYINSGSRITNLVNIGKEKIAIQITNSNGINTIEFFDSNLNYINSIRTKFFVSNGEGKSIYLIESLDSNYIKYNIWRYEIDGK